MKIKTKLTKENCFLLSFFLLYIVGELYVMFFWKDPFSSNRAQLFQNWLFKNFRFFGLICIIASGIIINIRSIRSNGYAHKKLIIPILLILFCTFLMGVSIYSYFSIIKVRNINANLQEQLFQTHNDNLKLKNLSFNFLSGVTKNSAQQYYLVSGKISKYYKADGTLIQYKPKIEEQEMVREYQKIDKFLGETSIFKSDILIWPIIVLVSILIGAWSPIKNKKPTNRHT
ncbi:MAG: hypothetical protein GY710_02395 [Desulfobacteraceae bacterium]|nr:hypothetical protein [Desulfobacteraceae bacterium]